MAMKILIDECLPKKLKRELHTYEVSTVPEMGWAGKKNGELLSLMITEFDVFITVDSNMSYQQNLDNYDVAFILLSATSNRLDDLIPLMEQVREILETIQSGDVVTVEGF
ncbi:MAG: hypothetical protein Phog2KO_08530 [Phototrophicaceae bacterium]